MPIVRLPPQIASAAGGERSIQVTGDTVLEVIAALEARHPGLGARLLDGERLRPGLAVAVDNVFVTPRAPVGEASEVQFIPALQGGL